MVAATDMSVALNRFGLGVRPDEPLPANPRRWLTEQFAEYLPMPAPIAALPGRAAVAATLVDYRTQVKLIRQERRAGAEAAATAAPAMPGTKAGMTPAMAPGMIPGMTAGAAPPRPAAPLDPTEVARKISGQKVRDCYLNAVGARAQVALTTSTPFVERLVWFWANHFAVSIDNIEVTGLAGVMEAEAIRPHVLGRFGDMLTAVEHHPAMLVYLDQAPSVGPHSVAGLRRGKRSGLNENLARETMELHTLGVGSGYTQADVTEFARALTGWTVAGLGGGQGLVPSGAFMFVDRTHEPGPRTILGTTYDQTGEAQAQAVLDDLAAHPATARHIATKLARHFVSDDPPPALVARLEKTFLRSNGDLTKVYKVLAESPEAWAPVPAKFKTPWEWSISSMRALGMKTVQPNVINGLVNQLGQPTWKPGSPAGFDDIAGSWAGPDAVMRRVEAAERFATRNGAQIDARDLAPKLFPATLTPATATALARAESPGQALALLLVAPEFLRR